MATGERTWKSAWETHRRDRFRSWACTFAWLPFVAIWSWFTERVIESFGAFVVGFVLYTVCLFVVAHRASHFACPRCRKPFYRTWWHNGFARKCVHCGLPKWSERDPDA